MNVTFALCSDDLYSLAIQLPRLLVMKIQPSQAHRPVRLTTHDAIHMFVLQLALGEHVKILPPSDETVGIASQTAIQVVEDTRQTQGVSCAPERVVPLEPLVSHRTSRLPTVAEKRRVKVVDDSCARGEEVFIVLGARQSLSGPRGCGIWINISYEDEVVKEWSRIDAIRQVIHVEATATFHKAMIIVNDVASRVVEHAFSAPERRERAEVVQRGCCMGGLEVPSMTTCMHTVVVEREVRLRTGNTTQLPQAPTTDSICNHVVSVPSSEARQPKPRRLGVVIQ
mmetsp:Transcript_30058/g.69208  ORF Transcript_30058/g.69208 Transcript_30058/m.69208 type:complete len:283 (-) Transcript_30058:1214-2062(-)